jgi:hypothetical protein
MLPVVRECATARFGDARLTQRLIFLVAKFVEHPNVSIPEALGEWASVKAAYRFFDNKKVTAKAIYDAHQEFTLERIKGRPVILAIQDTTSFNYTLHRKTEGLGPIGQAGLSGFFLHSCLAVSKEGVPLGILAHHEWARSPESKDSHNTHKNRPLDDKESARWIDMTREVAKVVSPATRVVMVGDRESDIFDLFLLADSNHDFLVRAAWDRRLDQSGDHLWDAVEKASVLGRTIIDVLRKDDRPTRKATLTLQSAGVNLKPPKRRCKEKLAVPALNALLVREEAPPEGVEPIEWLLLTTLPVTTLEDALQCLT